MVQLPLVVSTKLDINYVDSPMFLRKPMAYVGDS